MPSLLDDPEAYAFAAQIAEDERKKLGLQSLLGGIGGLLEAPVNYVKERATALATDPIGDMKRTMQGTIDRAKQREQLQQIAYGDPQNPLRVTDQAAADQLANEYLDMASTIMPAGMTVFHGSPYKFNAFDPTKIGSGEGAQAYGYGHYVAESPDVAKQYRDVLRQKEFSKIVEKGRNSYDVIAPDGTVIASDVLYGNANKAKNAFDESVGSIYKIDIPDEQIANMMDWDKPISKQPTVMKALRSEAEQRVRDRLQIDVENEIIKGMPPPELSGGYMDLFSEANIPLNKKVQEQALEKINQMDLKPLVEKELDSMKPPDMTWDMSGQDFYQLLSTRSGAPEKASDVLRNQGVPGIRYLDQSSRGSYKARTTYKGQPYGDLMDFRSKNTLDEYIQQKQAEGFDVEVMPGTSNFVVFPKNEGLLKIEEVNGQAVRGGLL